MATAKREIYARMATQILNHKRCTIAEKACPGAMGLYLFLVVQSRHEQTHGETLEDIAFASWGAPTAYRRKQAAALIKSGLVEELAGELLVVRYLDHNDGPEEIADNKAAAKGRQDRRRHPDRHAAVTRDNRVTEGVLSRGCPSSISCSPSGSGSADHRSEDPTGSPRALGSPANDGPPLTAPLSLVETPPGSQEGAPGRSQAPPAALVAPARPDASEGILDGGGLVRADLPLDPDAVAKFEAMTMTRPLRTPVADVWVAFCGHFAGQRFGSREGVIGRWQKWISNQFRYDDRERNAPTSSRRGTGGGPRGDRQGLDGYTPPLRTGTDADHPFGDDT